MHSKKVIIKLLILTVDIFNHILTRLKLLSIFVFYKHYYIHVFTWLLVIDKPN